MRSRLDSVQRGLGMIDDAALRSQWADALAGVADQHGVHGAVAGRAVRLLLDGGRLDGDDAARRLSRALSRGSDAAEAAAWIDGFLSGDAALLLHDDALLAVIDEWVADVDGAVFDDLLPLLRRTFSAFAAAERRMIAERVRRLDGSGSVGPAAGVADESIDVERARRAVPLLRQILGVEP